MAFLGFLVDSVKSYGIKHLTESQITSTKKNIYKTTNMIS